MTQQEQKKSKSNYLNGKDLLEEVMKSKEQDEMTPKLVEMLQLLTKRYAKKANFAGYCVDQQTEALTKRGWLQHNQITTDDEILSYDTTTGNLKWSPVHGVYIDSYQGYMHYLTTQGMDALVTPEHKFVSSERDIIRVEDIICNEHIVLTGTPVEDNGSFKLYSDPFVEFVGWAVTEGHYVSGSVNKHAIIVYQNEGPKAKQIRTCLHNADIHYSEHYHRDTNLVCFNCNGSLVSEVYSSVAPNRIPTMNFILSLTQEQRLLLIETMVSGDGWFRPNKGMCYAQKDPNHIDAFLVLCTIAGLTTTTRECDYFCESQYQRNGSYFSTNIFVQPKLQCKAERIDFHGGRASPGGRREQKQNVPTVYYDGIVWCPQTDFGTFVCRRNGTIYVTGNSYNEDMQAYAMLMLVKTWKSFDIEKSNNAFAFFTQCIKNSFIQYLNQERRQRDIRDKKLLDNGLSPSHTFQMDNDIDTEHSRAFVEDEEEFVEQPIKMTEHSEEQPPASIDNDT